jgi:hypothetical protein
VTFVTEGLIVGMGLIVIRKQIGITPRIGDLVEISKQLFYKKGKIF